YYGANPDDALPADDGLVVNDDADADQRAVADRAAVQHRPMADGDVAADRERNSGVDVQDGAILDVGVVANLDRVVVGAQHGAGPDGHAPAEPNAPDDRCALRDVSGRRNVRRVRAKLEDCHRCGSGEDRSGRAAELISRVARLGIKRLTAKGDVPRPSNGLAGEAVPGELAILTGGPA